jgi:hypothetical protein
MAIYKVSCGHCGDNNILEASSDEHSLEKHNSSKSHIENKTRWEEHISNFTHGKDHN